MGPKSKIKYIFTISEHDDLRLACQEALHNKIIIDYNERMKSNDFRHFYDNVCSKFVALVLF